MRPAGVETAPTVTFGCSFSTSQSGRVSSRSGSPPGATSASRTPGPSRARIPPRKRRGAASGGRSALTRDLGEEALDALDVRRPWQALGEAARGGAETRSVGTEEHEDGVRQRVPPPEPEEKVESLPPEPAPDGDAEASAVGDAELVPDARAERRARGGVEALEIDAVVDDRNPLARDAVVARDLVPDPFGYREHAPVAARAELPALEPEDRAAIRTERPAAEARRPHAREVRAMRPAADAHHVLPRRAPEAHHHVPALARHEPRRRERE